MAAYVPLQPPDLALPRGPFRTESLCDGALLSRAAAERPRKQVDVRSVKHGDRSRTSHSRCRSCSF